MKSGFKVVYSFEYENFKDNYWSYDVPFEIFVDGIREYFSKEYMVELDGKDNDVWSMMKDLDALDNIFDEMESWYEDRCEPLAYEAFVEYAKQEQEYARKFGD